jgi:hypothetical protein
LRSPGFKAWQSAGSPHRQGRCVLSGRSFVLVVVDRDTGEFTVEGPMTDVTLDAAAMEWQAVHGGPRIAAGSIVSAR